MQVYGIQKQEALGKISGRLYPTERPDLTTRARRKARLTP